MKKFEEKYLKIKYEIFLKISQIDLEEKKIKITMKQNQSDFLTVMFNRIY